MFYTKRPKPTKEKEQRLCFDKGYDYDEIREFAKKFGFTAHIRSRGEETKDIKRKAGQKARHCVERIHS